MKVFRIWSGIFLLVAFHSLMIGQISDWYWLSPYPQGNSLFSVTTIGPRVAFAVGRNGTILSTVTAGEYWRSQFNAGGVTVTLRSVAFIDEQRGVAVGDSGTILRTSDGGENWVKVAYPFIGTFNSIKVLHQNILTIVGDSGTILQSPDNGANWIKKGFPYSPLKLNDITAIDDLTWFAIGDNAVFHSTNGGVTWDSTVIPLGYLRTITFPSSNVGYITSWAAFNYIVRTTDRGKTWANQGITGTGVFGFLGMAFVNSSNGYLVGFDNMYTRGIIYGTTDGGASWFYSHDVTTDTLQGIAAFPDSWLVIGTDGVILKNYGTSDWTQISSGPLQSLTAICFPRPGIGVLGGQLVFHKAPGERTYLFRSSDGGLTWQQTYAVYQDTTARIVCGKDSIVVAVGFGVSHSYGTVYRSSDLGTSWTVPASSLSPLVDACRVDSTIWAVGARILRSTNIGFSWDTVLAQNFTAVSFITKTLGWVAGPGGKILQTTNGGGSWITQYSPVLFTPNALRFVNPDTGVIVGDGGIILQTTNGGINWIQRFTGTGYNLSGIAFVNSSQAVAVGNHGTILYSYDAGRTWVPQSPPTINNFHDVTVVRGAGGSSFALRLAKSGRELRSGYGFPAAKQKIDFNDEDPLIYVVGDEGLVMVASLSPLSARAWTGLVDSSWNNPANWTPGGIPLPGDSVIIPGTLNYQPVIFQNQDQIVVSWLRIGSGATLTVTGSLKRLTVMRDIIINGTMKVQPLTSTTIIIGGNWILKPGGNSLLKKSVMSPDQGFLPSQSTVYFEGAGTFEGNFYNIVFDTASNMTSEGNGIVMNQCTVFHDLMLRGDDTLYILNTSTQSLIGDQKVIGGTISRLIQQGSSDTYRFESPDSYLKFNGTGTYPARIAMTSFPDKIPPNGAFQWQVVGGVVDTVHHLIRASSVGNFSKWVMGIPRVLGATGDAVVHREYTIEPLGGSGFAAEVQLAYQPSEIPPGTIESSLKLLRGPIYSGTVNSGWNMISLPLLPHPSRKDSVFPTAISPAFGYAGAYYAQPDLEFGVGYWLRFPAVQSIPILGDYREHVTIAVNTGWNLIGSVSFPLSAANVTTDPPGLRVGSVFGYDKGYQVADSLMPLRAYWINMTAPGSVVLTSGDTTVRLREKIPSTMSIAENLNFIRVTDAGGNSQTLYFGKLENNTNLQLFALPPVPPPGIFDLRYTSAGLLEINDSTRLKEVPILISSAVYPLKIRWGVTQVNAEGILIIDGAREIHVQETGELRLDNPQSSVHLQLKPLSGSKELPMEFALEQNYPNPFNPLTTIRYQLPVVSRVKLMISNVLGQVVQTLKDDIEEAGYKMVTWDARTCASGVYFCRLEIISLSMPVKTFIGTRKIALVK